MGSESTVAPRVPVISLRGDAVMMKQADWISACRDMRRALEDYGWFELVYDKPSEDVDHSSVHDAMDELFSLPQETKRKNKSSKLAQGYTGGKSSVLPNLEGLGIQDATDKESCEAFTNLMWPRGNSHFCEVVHSYALMLAEVQKVLVKMLMESYGIGKEKEDAMADSTTYLLRMLCYKRIPSVETNIGFKAHIDKTFITILHQNHVDGLEVRSKDGGQWIPYRPSSTSSFAVLAGDILMGWSNDRIKSCYHRSIIDGDETRYVVGMFTFMTGIIEAPEELVDEEHPLQYKPFVNEDYLKFYASSSVPNKNEANMLKEYCGV